MSLLRQLWTLRATISVIAAVIIQRCVGAVMAQETIQIWRAGVSHTVEALRNQDPNQHWLEFTFPPGTAPLRIHPSDHYFWLANQVVGFRARWRSLDVHWAFTKTALESHLKSPEALPGDCEPPGFFSSLDWESIFGVDTTAGHSSAIFRSVTITNIVSTVNGAEFQVRTYMKHRGSLKLNHALELVEVRLEGESIPIFHPRLPEIMEESRPASISTVAVEGSKGEKLRVWITTLQSEKDHYPIVAKAFLNGSEVTWFGPRDPQFYVDQGKLIGVTVQQLHGLLFREAIPTASMNGEFFTATNIKQLEQKFFRGHVFRIDNLAAELGRSESSSVHVRSVKKDDDVFLVLFDGLLETREIPELLYAPARNSASVRMNRSEYHVEVEPFQPTDP